MPRTRYFPAFLPALALVLACSPRRYIPDTVPLPAGAVLALVRQEPDGFVVALPERGYLTAWELSGSRLTLLLADSISRPMGTTTVTLDPAIRRAAPAAARRAVWVPAQHEVCRADNSRIEVNGSGISYLEPGNCIAYESRPRLRSGAYTRVPVSGPILLFTLRPPSADQVSAALALPMTTADWDWPEGISTDSAFAGTLAGRLGVSRDLRWGFLLVPVPR